MPVVSAQFDAGPRNVGRLVTPLLEHERPFKLGSVTAAELDGGGVSLQTSTANLEFHGASYALVKKVLGRVDGRADVARICRSLAPVAKRSDVLAVLHSLMGYAFGIAPDPAQGAGRRSVIVVDDFLPDADQRRREAIEARYLPIDWFYFPGRFSEKSPDNVNRSMKRIEELVGVPLVWSRGPIHGHYRTSLRSSARRSGDNVHTDPFSWNAVLCLSRDEDCEGGVSFFRHKATGLHGRDESSFRAFGGRFGAFLDEANRLMRDDGPHFGRWDEVARVNLRFNRLILFRPTLFHAVNRLFGTSIRNGRLTQGFSCYTPDDPARYEAWA
jgi:hypothetical protein